MNKTKEFWDRVYRTNAPKLKGICYRYVADIDIAEDLMHDAFITAINKACTFSGKGNFNAWLYRIAVNTSLMYLRSIKAKKIEFEDLEKMVDDKLKDEINPENIKQFVENTNFSINEILEILNLLPEIQKTVFNLHVIDKFSHAQISKELNIKIGTSKSHLSRARENIKCLLYEKAIEKNKQKKRKATALIVPLGINESYLDLIIKTNISKLELKTNLSYDVLVQGVNWSNTYLPNIQKTLFHISIKTGAILVSSVTIITFLTLNNVLPITNDNSSILSDTSNTNNDSLWFIHKTTDLICNDTLNNSLPVIQEPVVITKKKVVRKTVIINKTFEQNDSIN